MHSFVRNFFASAYHYLSGPYIDTKRISAADKFAVLAVCQTHVTNLEKINDNDNIDEAVRRDIIIRIMNGVIQYFIEVTDREAI